MFTLLQNNPLLNHLRRALRRTFSAVGTQRIINHSQIIFHMDCTDFTLLGTQGTSDTSVFTFGLNVLALIVGRTLYQMLCLIRH